MSGEERRRLAEKIFYVVCGHLPRDLYDAVKLSKIDEVLLEELGEIT